MSLVLQSSVNIFPAVGVEGDFASENPHISMTAPYNSGQYVAGYGGVNIGKFAFDTGVITTTATTNGGVLGGVVSSLQTAVSASNTTANSPAALWNGKTGFVHREQQGLITTFLANSGVNDPIGYGVTLMSGGDYWARFSAGTLANGLGLYTGGATIGQSVWANFVDGSCISAPSGSPPTGGTVNGSSGTASGSGTTLTIAGTVAGYFAAGQPLQATTGVSAGISIVAQLTGTPGGAGTYLTSAATTISAAALTSTAGYLTKFEVSTTAAVGELAKISSFAW